MRHIMRHLKLFSILIKILMNFFNKTMKFLSMKNVFVQLYLQNFHSLGNPKPECIWSYFVLRNLTHNISQHVGGLYFMISLKVNFDRIVIFLLILPIISQQASVKMRSGLWVVIGYRISNMELPKRDSHYRKFFFSEHCRISVALKMNQVFLKNFF